MNKSPRTRQKYLRLKKRRKFITKYLEYLTAYFPFKLLTDLTNTDKNLITEILLFIIWNIIILVITIFTYNT